MAECFEIHVQGHQRLDANPLTLTQEAEQEITWSDGCSTACEHLP